jgi:hypothetical protein
MVAFKSDGKTCDGKQVATRKDAHFSAGYNNFIVDERRT